MNYSKLIKALRERMILSQSELADLLEVSFSSVSRWENGKHEPTIKAKRRIVQLCKENEIEMEERNEDQVQRGK